MRTEEEIKNLRNLKALIRGIYDLQKLRIQAGNRVTQNIKTKLGQEPGIKEDKIEKEAQKYLKTVREHFKLITNGLLCIPTQHKFKPDDVFDDYTEMNLAALYSRVYEDEQLQLVRLKDIVPMFAIWNEFLVDVAGCGEQMAGIIISTLDPYKAKYPSCFHKYAGLDVVEGKGRSRRKEHLIDQTYIDKEGDTQLKKGLSFNPFLKTKLIGVLGSCFLKQPAEKCKYRRVYDNYKLRLQNMPAHKEKSKGHVHNMCIRYMIKLFLIDLYVKWREIEGLEVHPSYAEAKLGLTHGKDNIKR